MNQQRRLSKFEVVSTGRHLQDKWHKLQKSVEKLYRLVTIIRTRKIVIERIFSINKATNRLKHPVFYNQSIGVPYGNSLFIQVMAVHVTKPMRSTLTLNVRIVFI